MLIGVAALLPVDPHLGIVCFLATIFYHGLRNVMVPCRSSAEAEYRGIANVVAETAWIRNLLCELHTNLFTATLVYCDNVSAYVCKFGSTSTHETHRDRHSFVRDFVASGQVRVLHVPSRFKKKTTCHPAFLHKLPTFRAVKTNLQVSEELTTSRGPGTCFQFSVSLVEQLFGESASMEIEKFLLMDTTDELSRTKEFNEVEWAVTHTPRVLIPVANGSEDIEVVTVVDILRRAKVDVTVASVEKTLPILGSQGMKMVADTLIKNAAESRYDLIILPGGDSGIERLQKSRILKRLLKEQVSSGRNYGAICSSPLILLKHGLLQNKKVTAHPSVLSKLESNTVVSSQVVIDGQLITCRGISSAPEFALAIIAKFFGHGRAKSVAAGLVFEYLAS
nr:protein DJ-1 homolog C [Tanacetum cinerariifolium]